jgi:hypothetical protein
MVQTYNNQWRRTQRLEPVLGPKQLEHLAFGLGFVHRNVEWIESLGLCTEIFDTIQRDAVFGMLSLWWFVASRIHTEGTDLDLASMHGLFGINLPSRPQASQPISPQGWRYSETHTHTHNQAIEQQATYNNGHEWVLEVLVHRLRLNVGATQEALEAWM